MKITLEFPIPKKRHWNAEKFATLMEKAKHETLAGMKDDFESTTSTWKTQVTFGTTRRGNDWYVATRNKIYGYVNEGTPPHPIPAHTPKGLAYFKTGFRAKTRVGQIKSLVGKAANKDFRRPMIVQHPGTEARKFNEVIGLKWHKKFITACRKAVYESSGKRA
jgi:hypothetical protein